MATQHMPAATPLAVQTPQGKTQLAPQTSPIQASPQRTTPSSGGKTTVIKALPTVRDHTTDQLGPDGDEYIPREIDEAGEKKVSGNGYPLDGREYKIRTFTVPNRGDKLFMLATECARVLGYRDSYLLFNKNRSLYKIIASQAEKDNLIHQEILPYSYRSRQIAIVTARSMFRQFGSRVIQNGRRVRDDYWESKARKQGFTEEDAAGEKRPGAAKQREAAAAEASNVSTFAMPHGEIIYSNGPGLEGGHPPVPPGVHPVTLAPLPMLSMSSDDLRPRDYGNIIRPRQELTGAPYQDRTIPSSSAEILNQATQAAEFNKGLTQQRAVRAKYYDDYWKRPHEPPTPPQTAAETEGGTIAPQNLQSPQANTNLSALSQNLLAHQQNTSQLMSGQAFPPQQPHTQNPLSQSPMRSMHQPLPSSQLHQSSPAMSMASASVSGRQPTPSYGYPGAGGQMWPPPQPQPSPLSQTHHMSQYGQHTPQQQSSMHPPSQMAGMGYGGLPQMPSSAYAANMNRGMYGGAPSPSPQQFGMGQQPGAGGAQQGQQGQQGMGWNPPSSMGQDWQQRF